MTTDYILKGTISDKTIEQTQSKPAHQQIAKGCNLLTTFLLAVGFLAVIANWYETQSLKDVFGGLVIQAVGVTAYFAGSLFTKEKASNRWIWCNAMLFLFVPLSLCVGAIWDYPKPYPHTIMEQLLFALAYFLMGAGLAFWLKKYRK